MLCSVSLESFLYQTERKLQKPLFGGTVRANLFTTGASARITSYNTPYLWVASFPQDGRLMEVRIVGHY